MTAYERHQESGEKEIVNGRHFRGAHPEFEDMTALFMGSYIFDEFLYPKLSPRKIDRDGYFSSFWFPLPEGCTGFETHEVGRGTYKGGWTEPEFFKFRDQCFPSTVGKTEVTWIISEGRVKLPDWVLQGEEKD